jgi:pimeloyl-ACP methyl ester carboxylesterase
MRTFHRTTIALALAFTSTFAASVCNAGMAAPVKNIILVHGFFADGSGWKGVADILARDGFHVTVVQEPETSFADDVKATRRALDAVDGASILVGHSYGGAVITEAGNHPKAAGLVYVAAFQPDVGESLKSLIRQKPPAGNAIKATADGYLYIDAARFRPDFAADLPAADATFMALSQVMPAAQLADAPVTQAAWKDKPSWAVISTADRTVNPDLQRDMAKRAGSKITEIKGSHVAFIAHPAAVAKVIEQAAAATGQ